MLMTIISTLFVGLIIGAVARFIMPGHQNISIPVTIALGAAGSLVGSWLCATILGVSGSAFSLIPFIVGVLCAIGFILLYGALTRRQV